MNKRKPTLDLDTEAKRDLPPFAVRTASPAALTVVPAAGAAITLPANASELLARRKPQLNDTQLFAKKDLPFALTSTPLPPPSAEAYPGPPVLKPIPESDYVNNEPAMTEEEKAQQLFMINYAATYGKVPATEARAAYDEHYQTNTRAKELSTDAEGRLKMARKQTQWPTWFHVSLVSVEIVVFIVLHTSSKNGLLLNWFAF